MLRLAHLLLLLAVLIATVHTVESYENPLIGLADNTDLYAARLHTLEEEGNLGSTRSFLITLEEGYGELQARVRATRILTDNGKINILHNDRALFGRDVRKPHDPSVATANPDTFDVFIMEHEDGVSKWALYNLVSSNPETRTIEAEEGYFLGQGSFANNYWVGAMDFDGDGNVLMLVCERNATSDWITIAKVTLYDDEDAPLNSADSISSSQQLLLPLESLPPINNQTGADFVVVNETLYYFSVSGHHYSENNTLVAVNLTAAVLGIASNETVKTYKFPLLENYQVKGISYVPDLLFERNQGQCQDNSDVLDTCDSELSQQQCFLDNSDLLTPACLELVSPAETPLGKLSLMLTEHDGLAYIYGKDTRVVQIDLNRLDDASSPRVAFVFPYGLYYHTATTYYDPVNYRVFTAAMDGLSNMILETDFLRRTYYGTVVDSAVQGQVLYVIPRSPASTTGPAPLIVGALLLSVVTWLR